MPITSFAIEKEKLFNEDVVDEVVFNHQLVDESLRLEQLPDELYAILENDIQDSVQIDEKTVSDLFSVGFVNSDGTKSLMTFDSPVKYLDDETGSICFIDNAFISTDDDNIGIAYANHGNNYSANFPVNISDGVSFSEAGFSINMKPTDVLENCEPQIVNNELVYDNAFNDNTDICYSLENSGIKESIIVYEPTGCSCYDFIISADGLVPETENGKSITLLDESNGEPVFVIQPTFIMDSYNGEYIDGEEHTTYDNYYDIEQQDDGTYLLRMNLDEEFLNAESTVYPCIIDPSIWAVNFSDCSSSYVLQSGEAGYINNQLSAGIFSGSGEHLSYIKANNINRVSWIEPNRLRSAEFRVKAASSGYTNSCTIECYDSTTLSNVSAVTYSELISSMGSLQSSTTFTTLGETYSFDLTKLFKSWISYELGEGGKNPDYGFILRGASGECTRGRYFSSTASSDTYFYLVYEEGEEIEDGFYNIRNVSTGRYLKYNYGNPLTLSSSPSANDCKWQIILSKSPDRTVTYGTYTIRPYHDLNVAMKIASNGQSVITNSLGNTFRIVRNSDKTFRIMPVESDYAGGGNALGISSNTLTTQNYSNISLMKWTFEPVVNRFFSEYTPEKFNNASGYDEIQKRANCYAYALGFMEHYYLSNDDNQRPGDFAEDKGLVKWNISPENIWDNMKLDAARLGYSIIEYSTENDTVEQFGSNSRLIAFVFCGYDNDFHFYMQHNDGTWSHKPGVKKATNLRLNCYNNPNLPPEYLNNENIKLYAGEGKYSSSSLRFYLITKDAVNDYPHGERNTTKPNTLYFTDMAGDNMFTSSSLSIGEQEGCIDTYNDVDFYVFKPTTTRNYSIKTTSLRISRDGVVGNIDVDDLDCEIYDKNGSLVYTAKNVGQVNKQFYLTGGQNYFIKIYNYSETPCNYTLTLS